MIEFKNVSKKYEGEYAIQDISLKIEPGEKFVLLGTSGSGKSTILKHINRLITSDTGSIHFDGQNINSINVIEHRRNTGYVIQEGGLFPHYTVKENIELVPTLLNTMSKFDISERTLELLESLKLDTNILTKYPTELSGGQMQRVGIARALAGNPELLLFDEPLSALDPITKSHILNDFISLKEYKTKTIVWVTHDLNEAVKVGSRICVLHQGQVQQISTPQEILLNPANSFVKTFFEGDKLQYIANSLTMSDLLSRVQIYETEPSDQSSVIELQAEDSAKVFLNGYKKNSTIKIKNLTEKYVYLDSADILSKITELSAKN